MKKIVLILMVVGLLAVAAVGCGGSDVPAQNGAVAEPVPLPDVVEPGPDVIEDLPGDVIEGDGSDIIFDEDIFLPVIGESLSVGIFAGSIISIEVVSGQSHVRVENDEGGQMDFVIRNDTVFPFSDSLNVGDEVTGWYMFSPNAPMTLQYPPMFDAAVFSAGRPDSANIWVDSFHRWADHSEDAMISSDERFAFTIDDNTVILTQDGEDYIDFNTELDRRIVVIYGRSMKSIPEQATADKLIVLFEGIMPLG